MSSNLSELAVLGEETTEELPWQEILFFFEVITNVDANNKAEYKHTPYTPDNPLALYFF